MLDDHSRKRLGPALAAAEANWQATLRAALARRKVPATGAGAELLALLTPEGVSQALLPERLGLSKQAVQQSLDQLERHNLVRRQIDPGDKRAKQVLLTEAGLYVVEARRDAEREVEREFRDQLGKKAFARLRKGLRALSAVRVSNRG